MKDYKHNRFSVLYAQGTPSEMGPDCECLELVP